MDALQNLPLQMNPHMTCTEPNYWLSSILLDEGCAVKPADLMERLAAENIESRPIWKPMHLQPLFKYNDFITVGEDVGGDIFSRGLCLPSDIKNTPEDMGRICGIIKEAFK